MIEYIDLKTHDKNILKIITILKKETQQITLRTLSDRTNIDWFILKSNCELLKIFNFLNISYATSGSRTLTLIKLTDKGFEIAYSLTEE